jgi:multidrug efflux pump subunit AcrB
MGPYMRPIPIGSSAAMIFSLLIAFTVTPYAASHILKRRSKHSHGNNTEAKSGFFSDLYHRTMHPLLDHTGLRFSFFFIIIALLLISCSLVGLGLVKVKMLPFDNKSEFQIILNMPEGSTLEQTTKVAMEMSEAISLDPAVSNYQIYAGTSSPYNFNGLVRHYFLRRGPDVADIQVNLKPKDKRNVQSHEIAKRIRPAVAAIAKKYGANVAVAEVPPGPPVLETLVAEIYGPTDADRVKLAKKVKHIFETTNGVVDVDWYREADRMRKVITIDKEKAALNGISEGQITRTIQMAVSGASIDLYHQPKDKEAINIVLELPRAMRARIDSLLDISLRPDMLPGAPLVPLRELVHVTEQPVQQPIYRKNLKSVIYVVGDVAGVIESPIYAILKMNKRLDALNGAEYGGREKKIQIYNMNQPFTELEPSIKWDGEWHVTLRVFRDLGIAFGVVIILIYMLMVGWFKDYFTPLVVMAAIPFSLIGILPAHWLLHAFFTATSMIGFMAGGGIVVRNSIILVDFIELRLEHGLSLKDAVIEAGAVRFRPMLLTAMAVIVGASVILADPIFQGLAISLMFGEIAALLVSTIAVPVLYYMLKKGKYPKVA